MSKNMYYIRVTEGKHKKKNEKKANEDKDLNFHLYNTVPESLPT